MSVDTAGFHEDYYLLHALHQKCYELAILSQDEKLKYGAVIVDDDEHILGRGWNYVPEGYDCAQCPRVLDKSIRSGTQLERCFAIHAEQDALSDLRFVIGDYKYTQNLTLWVLGVNPADDAPILLEKATFTCSVCARMMYAFNIDSVVVATTKGPVKIDMHDALAMSFAHAEENKL